MADVPALAMTAPAMKGTGELTSADAVAATLDRNVENLVAALGTFKKESAS